MKPDLSSLPCAEERYGALKEKREPYLRRARKSSKYTIPYLFREEGSNASTDLPDPHQSVGSRGVNNLAGKLLLTLIPPSRLFYRLMPTREAEQELLELEKTKPKVRTELEESLSLVEQEMLRELARTDARPTIFEALRYLLVGGNALVFLDKDETRLFTLDRYAVARSYSGELLELVTEEEKAFDEMPDDWRAAVLEMPLDEEGDIDPSRPVKVYTRWAKQSNGTWIYYQEAMKTVIPGTYGVHGKKRAKPFLDLRWTKVDGEPYGRSFCDDYMGDLRSAEGLSRAITRAAAVGAKVIYLVRPGAITRPEDLEAADDGEFVVGLNDDIEPLEQSAKQYDLAVAQQVLAQVTNRLEFAFLLASAIRRDAERVTAEEIRRMDQELQVGLGGPYSVLSQDLQQVLAALLLERVSRNAKRPDLPKRIETTLITGVDALGRNAELQDLTDSIGTAVALFGEEALMYLNKREGIARVFAAGGIRTNNLIRSEDEVQAEMQQRQMADLAEKAAGPVAGNLTRDANG